MLLGQARGVGAVSRAVCEASDACAENVSSPGLKRGVMTVVVLCSHDFHFLQSLLFNFLYAHPTIAQLNYRDVLVPIGNVHMSSMPAIGMLFKVPIEIGSECASTLDHREQSSLACH